MDSSRKRTNEFVFTSMRCVFVCFLDESLSLTIIWPLTRSKLTAHYLNFSSLPTSISSKALESKITLRHLEINSSDNCYLHFSPGEWSTLLPCWSPTTRSNLPSYDYQPYSFWVEQVEKTRSLPSRSSHFVKEVFFVCRQCMKHEHRRYPNLLWISINFTNKTETLHWMFYMNSLHGSR